MDNAIVTQYTCALVCVLLHRPDETLFVDHFINPELVLGNFSACQVVA